MVKNTRIIRIDKKTIGLILDKENLLVIMGEHFVTLGRVPDDIYPIHPEELMNLPWSTKVIINSVLISHGLKAASPFLSEMTSNTIR